jgi:phospholipase/lecithinase/hemolysin
MEGVMGYSGVFTFGDSLVDGGNALKLAETYDYFPFTDLPDGAPTSSKGYYSGTFTNGWTFADLISNTYVGAATKSVFPFGYDDPYLGISFGFFSDPDGNNLNFAYGGAQIRQGDEAVPDLDDQTDAYRDAVDGDADPNALHLFVFGANDVHDLVPKSGSWATLADATSALQKAADEFIEELLQTIDIGARHILVTGIPDIGIQPYYNGSSDEAARRAVATEYAEILDGMIQAQLYKLQIPGVEFHFISFADLATSVLGTMVDLYGASEIYPLNLSNEVFFDAVHPTAQMHALAAAQLIDVLNGAAGDRMPLTAPDFSADGSIAIKGEVDTITISLAANTSYIFDLLGLSTLGGNYAVLADPLLKVLGPGGLVVATNDDGGVGLDAALTFTSAAAGDYTIQLSGVGIMTGSYRFQALGQATGNDSYAVSHAGAIVLEHTGGGFDTVSASVSYALNAGAEVEVLRTSNDKGKTALNLTGNEFSQTIIGNGGNNIIEGKAGADVVTGGAGKDVFVLSMAAVTSPGAANIDRITDYASGDMVDLTQILSLAAGTNVVSGQYARVTTSGLIQVDLDGGGNNWVTLSQINNGGGVTVRYLSGGVATTLSLSRVAATSNVALASAVAAAGLTAAPLTAHSTTDAGEGVSAIVVQAVAGIGFDLADRGTGLGQSILAGEIDEAIDLGRVQGLIHGRSTGASEQSLTGPEPSFAPFLADRASATEPIHIEANAAVGLSAHAVAMPSADMLPLDQTASADPSTVARIVAEALASDPPDVDGLLAALPDRGWALADGYGAIAAHAAAAWGGFGIATSAAAHLPIEALAMHPDAAPTA